MKKLLTLLLALSTLASAAQGVQKQEKISGLNAYTYYPVGYETGKKFPLILFFPGLGEAGTNASLLLRYGPNKFTAAGWKPDALVISVQPTYGWVNERTIDQVLTAIVNNYQVDTANIHLTGLSAGGSGIEQYALTPAYAKKITSVVPMSAPEVTAWYKNIPEVTQLQVSWLGFCGSNDSHYAKMQNLFERLNASVDGIARFVAGSYGHCCWNDFYNPSYKLPGTGQNIYEWMLQQGKITLPPVDPPAGDTLKYIQIQHDPTKVQKVIILDKDGRWTEYDSSSVSSGAIKISTK